MNYERRLKIDYLRGKGHRVVEMWECQFKKELEVNHELRTFYAEHQPYLPINPRDPFFGGRTNAVRLFCEPEDDQQIRYVDFTR